MPLSIEGWSKFPVSRPVEQKVIAIIDGVEKVGRGVMTPRFPLSGYSGAAIKIDGRMYDSEHVIYWKYLS